jgi:hypothetical protein
MNFLSELDLEGLASDVQGFVMTDTCQFLAATVTQDSQGGQTSGSLAVTSTSPCTLIEAPKLPKSMVDDQQLIGVTVKMILLPRGTIVADAQKMRVQGVVYRALEPTELDTYGVMTKVYVTYDELGRQS